MSTVCVDQDHEIVSKTRILDPCVLAVACGLLCSLKHTVHLIEVDITEQWGDHSALRDAAATIRFQHDFQQVHHVIIVDSLRHFGQQQVVPNVVKGRHDRLPTSSMSQNQWVITRKRHPFEGRSLAVIHSIRRRGVRLVLVILPNGTRSLIPAAWTDWNPESAELCGSTSNISHNLGRLDDLLRLRVLINALLGRPSESAPHEGSSHAIAPRISRADGSVKPDNSGKPS